MEEDFYYEETTMTAEYMIEVVNELTTRLEDAYSEVFGYAGADYCGVYAEYDNGTVEVRGCVSREEALKIETSIMERINLLNKDSNEN